MSDQDDGLGSCDFDDDGLESASEIAAHKAVRTGSWAGRFAWNVLGVINTMVEGPGGDAVVAIAATKGRVLPGVASVNPMNTAIRRGQGPRSIKRADKAKVKGEQDNIHFDDGSALNRNGTWKHGGRELTNAEREWLGRWGFRAPPN